MFNYSKSELIVVPIMYVVIYASCVLLYFLLKDKKENIKRIPLIVITVLLLAFEVGKQISQLVAKTWTTWCLPFHYCSSFYIWFAIMSFAKNEKVRQIGYATSIVGSFMLSFLFLFNPSAIVSSACDNPFGDFGNFHTLAFHFISMMPWCLIIILKLYKPSIKNILISTASYVCFFIFATIFAYALNTNFINLLTSNVPFMENIRVKCGQVIYTFLMYFIGIAVCLIILFLYKILSEKISLCILKRKQIIDVE